MNEQERLDDIKQARLLHKQPKLPVEEVKKPTQKEPQFEESVGDFYAKVREKVFNVKNKR